MARQREVGSAYERTFLGIAITIVVLWAAATAVQIVFPNHPVPETLNIVMGTVATAFFGGALVSSRRRNIEDVERGRDYYDPPDPPRHHPTTHKQPTPPNPRMEEE